MPSVRVLLRPLGKAISLTREEIQQLKRPKNIKRLIQLDRSLAWPEGCAKKMGGIIISLMRRRALPPQKEKSLSGGDSHKPTDVQLLKSACFSELVQKKDTMLPFLPCLF